MRGHTIEPLLRADGAMAMIPPAVIAETERRFHENASSWTWNLQRLRSGATLEMDTPDHLRKRIDRLARARIAASQSASIPAELVEPVGTATMDLPIEVERVLGKSELLDISFLERGVLASRPVGRISIQRPTTTDYGTGFLVSPLLLLTASHVLPSANIAHESSVEFLYEEGPHGKRREPISVPLAPDVFFVNHHGEFTLVAIGGDPDARRELGWLELSDETDRVITGERLSIVGHPNGEPKRLALRENRLITRLQRHLHYLTATAPGSSGAPVFNDQWEVVAVHHSGVPRRDTSGDCLTRDGRKWIPPLGEHRVDWIAGEGIRIGAILESLTTLQGLTDTQRHLRDDLLRSSMRMDNSSETSQPRAREPARLSVPFIQPRESENSEREQNQGAGTSYSANPSKRRDETTEPPTSRSSEGKKTAGEGASGARGTKTQTSGRASRSSSAAADRGGGTAGREPSSGGPSEPPAEIETTGRYIVVFAEGRTNQGIAALSKVAGISAVRIRDAGDDMDGALRESGAVVSETLEAAVVDGVELAQLQEIAIREGESAILAVEPERIVHIIDVAQERQADEEIDPLSTPEGLLTAAHDLVDLLVRRASAVPREPWRAPPAPKKPTEPDREAPTTPRPDEEVAAVPATWGLQVTEVVRSRWTGRGIKVAVLDTGFGPHPDFATRQIRSRSFISGETAADGHGHGTHCIGTACGPRTSPRQPQRYGVAYEAEIFAGKVLSNRGSGADGSIIAGLDWAISNGCRIVSMSLGAVVPRGYPFSEAFEIIAQRALRKGTLIIAAAGNNSARPQTIMPVNHPANCPSIMAVAAIDRNLNVAPFSCGGVNPNGGAVDIAGPGVDVRSSWPLPPLYRNLNGTSMATPHVAGIAALISQGTGRTGKALWDHLVQNARSLPVPREAVGAGLVIAR